MGLTFLEIGRAWARERPDKLAFLFLENGEVPAARLTFGELDRRARGVAAALQELNAAGERTLLLYPSGLEFITAFLGCLYAGAVAVPAYPPRSARGLPRLCALIEDARPRFALVPTALVEKIRAPMAPLLGEQDLSWLGTDHLAGRADDWRDPGIDGAALAFLQYTSGSTSTPKGVMVTHGNLVHNAEVIHRACEHTESSVMVSWLPVYHDMGLIAGVLQPLFMGGLGVLMPPVAFLQKPSRWLEAVSRYGGTTSGGPNFAYEVCVRAIGEETKAGLDLASWRTAFNGAEPVRAETLERFARAFAPCGFRREALYPCYGLAESTLFVTGGKLLAGPALAAVSAAHLAGHRIADAEAEGEPAQTLVGCGGTWLGQQVAIADPETLRRAAPDRVGEIWVSGASVAAGYWNQPEATRRDFGARLADEPEAGPFLRTGDLGFVRGGELFVTGRIKDLLIIRGRNHYPQDVELTAERSHPALRAGCGAAFAVEVDGQERLAVVQEIERGREAEAVAAAEALRRAVAEEHEISAWDVVVVRAGTVPKTTSGKIQRQGCRAQYLAGELTVVGHSLAETLASGLDEAGLALTRETLLGLPADGRAPALTAYLRHRAGEALGVAPGQVPAGKPLTALGLDSLGAVRLQHWLETDFQAMVPLAAFLEGASPAGLADRLLADIEGGRTWPEPISVGTARRELPLSHGQRGLWFLDRLAPGSAAYHIAVAARVVSDLDAGALRRALAALAARHAALRTTFSADADEPVQRVGERPDVEVLEADASAWSDAELAARSRQEAARPFDLTAGPPLRVGIFRRGDEHVLVLALHHLLADFTSMGVLAADLAALYAREAHGGAGPGPPPAASYGDFVSWQREMLAGAEGERLWSYWRGALAGAPPALDLPADRPRPLAQTWRGAVERLVLGDGAATAVRALVRRHDATPFMASLAALQALLCRHTGQEDLTVGSPTAGRSLAAFDDVIGYFVNPVALRGDLSGDPPFAELLARTRATALDAFAHGDFPFPLLTERLQPERDPARSPLFQVMLVLQGSRRPEERGLVPFALGLPGARIDLGGLSLEALPLDLGAAKLDLTLALAEVEGAGLAASLEYAADLFDAATARRLLERFHLLLEGACREPGRRLSDLPLLRPEERRQILEEWAGACEPSPEDACLHGLFAAQTARTPEAVALVRAGIHLSYRELRRRADRLAAALRGQGVGPEARVGVLLDRTPEAVISLLGILAAGGAYLPLDPSYPTERLALMLEDSQAAAVLTRGTLGERLGSSPVAVLDVERLDGWPAGPGGNGPGSGPGNLAYVIYTSGSTGRPKGVAIEHRGAVSFLRWARQVFPAADLAGVLASTSLSFDLSVFELFAPLAWGGRVVLAEDALELASLGAMEGVSLINTVPSAIAELVRLGAVPPSVRTVNLAGEPLPGALASRIYSRTSAARVLNLYGPSESTTYATFCAVPRDGGEPSIGRPLSNTRAYLLDRLLLPVPPGAAGELCLGGQGLARGYLGRPELTAERFVPDPFSPRPGDRLYRTGDLARHRPDGELDFLGRLDHQVKLRGYRIELGEIEAVLAAHPEVAQAVVLVARQAGGDARLAAFAVPRGGARPSSAALRRHLAGRLPAYMVPAALAVLPALPLTPNGKIDRRALAGLAIPEEDGAPEGSATPRTPVEEILAGIFAEVLGAGPASVHQSFFHLGGHSLSAARVVARVRAALAVELPLRALFEAPTVASLAQRVEAARRSVGAGAAPPLVPVPRAPGPHGQVEMPPSFAQERLWFLDQLQPGTPLYNVPVAVRLRGPLQPAALAAALRGVAARHEALRTLLAAAGGRPVQVIAPVAAVPLPLADLGGLAEGPRGRELARLVREEAGRPFDLARGPLLRAALVRLGEVEHAVLLTLHHAIGDGWSLRVLFRDLAALYGAAAAGEAPRLPALPVQYADFAAWQRSWLRGEALESELSHWRRRLTGAPPVLELPADRPRPPVRSLRGAGRELALPPGLRSRLEELSRRQGSTLFMTLLAAFQALLGRWSGQDDLCVGAAVAGRDRVEVEDLVGFFANTLVLRADLAGDPPFAVFLARIREAALDAYTHQDVPFERLVEELRPERDLAHTPVIQVVFTLDEDPLAGAGLPGLALEPLPLQTATAKFDLTLLLTRSGPGGLAGTLEYGADLFDAATAERFSLHLATLLAGIAADPEAPLSRLPLMPEAQRHQLLQEWVGAAAAYPREASVHRLFERRAAATPDAVALALPGFEMTYAELDRRSGRLARALWRLGVGPDVPVGLCVERSPEMVVGTLAILKAGGAYVPLDPAHPRERLAFMLEDTGAPVVLAQERWREVLAGAAARVLWVDRAGGGPAPAGIAREAGMDAGPDVGPEALAYVMYTSGSTGLPKGVAVPHRGVARLVCGADYVRLGSDQVFLQLAPVSFDAATLEIWGPLLHGGRLALFPPHVPTLEEIGRALELHGVTLLWLTAGLFHQMVEDHLTCLGPVRQLLAGGDVLSVSHVRAALAGLPGVRLINGYGPTENTTFTCCHQIAAPGPAGGSVPIGRPIANTRVLLLDRRGAPVPAGFPGELCAGGDGLARGYFARPDLTAARFVPDPLSAGPGGRLYRTGDLARWLPDGTLEFLGRIDQQVKVRGHRVELEEIEAVLARCPGVRACAVVVREDAPGDRRLAAYWVPDGEALPAAGELQRRLREALPAFMVPSVFAAVEVLPLSPNGKVDRRALAAGPAPRVAGVAEPGAGAGDPRNPAEELLAGIWAEVLGAERVGIHDDFFALGGHSLLATRVISRVREAFRLELPLQALFEAPTVAGLAPRLAAGRGDAAVPAPVRAPAGAGAPPLSFAQERLWFLDQLDPGSPAYDVSAALRLDGPLVPAALAAALAGLIERHEPLRTTFAEEQGRPVQVISPARGQELSLVDLGALPREAGGTAALRLAEAEVLHRFDLARGPLLRTTLLRLGEGEHLLLLNVHHIVADGWSLGVMTRELAALYRAALAERPAELPPLPIRYADFARWQRERLAAGDYDGQWAYWRQRLAGAPAALDLPADFPRPAARSLRGAQVPVRWPAPLARDLAATARRHGATLFMAILAGLDALLCRITGEDDLLVGSPVANRGRAETEELVGFFVNTLVLRSDLAGDPAFERLLAGVRDGALAAYAHQDLPFEKLVAELMPERQLALTPLFQVMLALQNAPRPQLALGPVRLVPLDLPGRTAKFDLTLSLAEEEGGFAGYLEYSTDLFAEATARRLLGHLANLLAGAAADPARRLSELPLLSAPERLQVLVEWNRTERAHRRDRCLHELFAAQAARVPGAVALFAGDGAWTYGELDRAANRLAHRLRALGVGPETPVGVLAARSAAMVTALLAVLKAGGAYVGLDPSYPPERLAFMMADCGAPLVLTDGSRPAGPLPGRELRLDGPALAGGSEHAPEPLAGPGNLAYLIYTSGSTGRPKAVAVEHGSAVALCRWAREVFSDEELSGVLAATSICFDLSVFELFVPLSWGGSVVLAANALELPSHPAAARVRLVNTVPSAIAELLRTGGVPSSVRTINLAGEPLQKPLADALHARTGIGRLWNLYGPSEDTTYSTFAAVRPGDGAAPSIGRPVAETRAYLLDRGGQPVPPGVPGELCLAGAGLARGYLGRPGLTAGRFVPDPFAAAPGGRLYRTGDLARWRAAGELEFLGRLDHQVKVRGFRVEPGEIEARLLAHPGVRQAVVVARGEGEAGQRLVAYVVPAAHEREGPGAGALRGFVAAALPEHLVPAVFVELAELPLTPSGKVDRRALPAPQTGAVRVAAAAPRSPLEELLAEAFEEVLAVPGVGIHDSFFALGGHSLLATRLASRVREALGVELPVRALFEAPTVAALAGRIEAARAAAAGPAAPPVVRAPRDGAPLPLSFSQLRQWFLDRLSPGDPGFNVPAAFRLDGRLAAAALARSLGEVIRRHEGLRTLFRQQGSGPEPVQVVLPHLALPLPEIDLEDLAQPRRQAELARLLAAAADVSFDLTRGPLLRFVLFRLERDAAVLSLNFHHMICDGWSLAVFVRETAALYDAFATRRAPALPEPALHYADYACWQRGWMRGEVLERGLGYWQAQLAGAPAQLDLPLDRPRPAVRSARGGSRGLTLGEEAGAALRALARAERASLFMVLLAGLYALLARLTGQRDLPVGTYIANRQRGEVEGVIGFFVNTLVLRTGLDGAGTFRDLLGRVREVTLDAYAHQDVPFERVLDAVRPPRNLSSTPLFQVLCVLQNIPAEPPRLRGLRLTEMPLADRPAHFDLNLWWSEQAGSLALSCQYARALFDPATAARLAEALGRVLAAAAADPGTPLADLPVLSPAQRQQALAEWSLAAGGPEQDPLPVHAAFAAQAARTPGAPALVFEGGVWTYRELAGRVERLARRLCRLGVGPEVPVAVCLGRSPELVAGLLAVLAAGGFYVPLDPAYPRQRLAFMLEDSRARVVLTGERWRGVLPALPGTVLLEIAGMEEPETAVERDPPPDGHAAAGNLAYVIYTSGSTGRPKGVWIEHRSLARYTAVAAEEFGLGPGDRVLQFASVSFDTSAEEIYPCLTRGAALVLRPEAVETAEDFLRRCRTQGITVLDLPTAYWHELVRRLEVEPLPESVRLVVIGGEEAQGPHLETWWRRVGRGPRLANTYGPTEGTIVSTRCDLERWQPAGGQVHRVPIGRPIAGVEAWVLDALAPVPPGAPGELCLAGAGLARGYLDRPGETAERFLPNPRARRPGERLYRTGDRARQRADGTLEFLGRLDGQVKVRGFRIEPGEIESALLDHPAVLQAAVVARTFDGDHLPDHPADNRRLVAYVVGAGAEAPAAEELRAWLRERLPDYLVPAAFMALDALPLAAGGKVDRAALPAPPAPAPSAGELAAARTAAEAELAGIWCTVLGLAAVGVHDNFFELGGDSILGIQVVARANQAGLVLSPQQLFQHQTIAELAAAAAVPGGPAPAAAEQGPVTGEAPPTPYQAWFFETLRPADPSHWNMALLLEMRRGRPPAALARAVAHLLVHHDALRTRFVPGPSGWRQSFAPPDPRETPFCCVDLSALPEKRAETALAAAGAAVQASLDLTRGPLLRAVLFRAGASRPDQLLLTLHHMVVDVVSWRILLEDLGVLLESPAGGAAPRLPAKTTSYRRWSERLSEHARSQALRQEARGWLYQAGADLCRLPPDFPGGANLEGSTEAVFVELAEEETRELLQEVPRAYNTQINDVLLTALAQAFARCCGGRAVVIDLEGHGREPLFADVDLSRTVGCFTTLFPVVLESEEGDDPGTALKSVKEQLRRIPHHGIGFGLLRYLSGDAAAVERLRELPPAEASFNYVGRFDQLLPESAPFAMTGSQGGPIRSPRAARACPLEILAGVSEGRLLVRWIYSRNLHRRESVAGLAGELETALRKLVKHCISPEADGFTPSDFQLAGLGQGDLDHILAQIRGRTS